MTGLTISTGLGLPAKIATEKSGDDVHTLLVKSSGGSSVESEDMVSGVTGTISDTTPVEVIGAQGAGVSIFVTAIMVTNSSATKTFVNITDGNGGEAKWTGNAPEDGGFSCSLVTPLKFSPNTAVYVECEDSSASVRVSLAGYKG